MPRKYIPNDQTANADQSEPPSSPPLEDDTGPATRSHPVLLDAYFVLSAGTFQVDADASGGASGSASGFAALNFSPSGTFSGDSFLIYLMGGPPPDQIVNAAASWPGHVIANNNSLPIKQRLSTRFGSNALTAARARVSSNATVTGSGVCDVTANLTGWHIEGKVPAQVIQG